MVAHGRHSQGLVTSNGVSMAAAARGRASDPLPCRIAPFRGAHARFYADVLRLLKRSRIVFCVGGTCAVNAYVGTSRATKDMDLFCLPGDFPKILRECSKAGFTIAVEDERWIAKIKRGRLFCDVIFNSANAMAPITSAWFKHPHRACVLGVDVRLLPPTELIWSKAFIKDRYKYDGNDIAHLFLTQHAKIDFKRLLGYMDQHWEVLLGHVLNFRFIYPSERERIPRWLIDELFSRLKRQLDMPTSRKKVCRGRIFSRDDFEIDVTRWGFADVVGDDKFSASE